MTVRCGWDCTKVFPSCQQSASFHRPEGCNPARGVVGLVVLKAIDCPPLTRPHFMHQHHIIITFLIVPQSSYFRHIAVRHHTIITLLSYSGHTVPYSFKSSYNHHTFVTVLHGGNYYLTNDGNYGRTVENCKELFGNC